METERVARFVSTLVNLGVGLGHLTVQLIIVIGDSLDAVFGGAVTGIAGGLLNLSFFSESGNNCLSDEARFVICVNSVSVLVNDSMSRVFAGTELEGLTILVNILIQTSMAVILGNGSDATGCESLVELTSSWVSISTRLFSNAITEVRVFLEIVEGRAVREVPSSAEPSKECDRSCIFHEPCFKSNYASLVISGIRWDTASIMGNFTSLSWG